MVDQTRKVNKVNKFYRFLYFEDIFVRCIEIAIFKNVTSNLFLATYKDLRIRIFIKNISRTFFNPPSVKGWISTRAWASLFILIFRFFFHWLSTIKLGDTMRRAQIPRSVFQLRFDELSQKWKMRGTNFSNIGASADVSFYHFSPASISFGLFFFRWSPAFATCTATRVTANWW